MTNPISGKIPDELLSLFKELDATPFEADAAWMRDMFDSERVTITERDLILTINLFELYYDFSRVSKDNRPARLLASERVSLLQEVKDFFKKNNIALPSICKIKQVRSLDSWIIRHLREKYDLEVVSR